MDWKKLLGSITESVDEELRLRNAYLAAENRILRQQINSHVPLTDGDRSALGAIGMKLGKKALAEIATVAKPSTILAWHRKFVDPQVDTSEPPKSVGRPRIDQAIEALVVRMTRENRSWGYDRIVGALANLGYTISDQTVGNILKRHGIPPAPERKKTVPWREFIRFHLDVLLATDFSTSAVWTWLRLVPHFVLSCLFCASGKMCTTGMTLSHHVQGSLLCTRNRLVAVWGVLKSGQSLLRDRDGTPCPPSVQMMDASGLHPLLDLPWPPHVTPIAAYGVPSARAASLAQLILVGERSLRQGSNQYAVPDHAECPHQDKGHGVRTPSSGRGRQPPGPVWWRARQSGLWQDNDRKAA
jgi:putative transposase